MPASLSVGMHICLDTNSLEIHHDWPSLSHSNNPEQLSEVIEFGWTRRIFS